MTKSEILSALEATISSAFEGLDPEETLSETQNVGLTDELAGVLETVNPNHNYPPVPKS